MRAALPGLGALRGFHAGLRACRRWTDACDRALLQGYARWGPAWALLAAQLPTRRTLPECRRRWLELSGTLAALPGPAERQLCLHGFEPVQDAAGHTRWLRVPLTSLPACPFARLQPALPRFRSSWARRAAGWGPAERLALREGYEQLVAPLLLRGESAAVVAAAWDAVALRFSRRTGTQCRNFFHRQFVLWDVARKWQLLLEPDVQAE